jgi:hypothetical protein
MSLRAEGNNRKIMGHRKIENENRKKNRQRYQKAKQRKVKKKI